MKASKTILFGFLAVMTAAPLFAGDQAEVWARLYRRSSSMEQKEMILHNIVRMSDRSLEPVLIDALEDMVKDQEKFRGDVALMVKWVDLTRLLVNELGELKTLDAEDLVYHVATHTDDPYLIADSLIALGNMRAVKFAGDISTMLRNLNFNTRQEEKDNAEIEAYGCVMALQKMRDPVGFEPVFYAYTGWYSKRTKNLAGEALKFIAEDPTDQVMAIMADADSAVKKIALMVEKESSASAENKNRVAIMALEEGLKYQTADKRQQDDFSKLRVEAMKILIENSSKDTAAVPFLKTTIDRAQDINEGLYAYYALGINGSDEAVDLLSEKLMAFNTRQRDGIKATREELEYIRQIIKSIGMSGNNRGMGALTEVQFSDYTPAINRLAREAMEALGG